MPICFAHEAIELFDRGLTKLHSLVRENELCWISCGLKGEQLYTTERCMFIKQEE